VNDPTVSDPWPDSDESPVRAGIRLLVLTVVFLLLPMLLLGASFAGQGCGEGG
jgi:hypothetical protein